MRRDIPLKSRARRCHERRPVRFGAAFSRFWGDESGSAAIEYTLVAAIVGLGLVAVLVTFQEDLVASVGGITNTILKY